MKDFKAGTWRCRSSAFGHQIQSRGWRLPRDKGILVCVLSLKRERTGPGGHGGASCSASRCRWALRPFIIYRRDGWLGERRRPGSGGGLQPTPPRPMVPDTRGWLTTRDFGRLAKTSGKPRCCAAESGSCCKKSSARVPLSRFVHSSSAGRRVNCFTLLRVQRSSAGPEEAVILASSAVGSFLPGASASFAGDRHYLPALYEATACQHDPAARATVLWRPAFSSCQRRGVAEGIDRRRREVYSVAD
jgi:hypothetical protein